MKLPIKILSGLK